MNIFENIPFNFEKMGNRKVVDTKELLIMQIALHSGQIVPLHEANSNVHIIVLEGSVVVNLNGQDNLAKKGDILPVEFKTKMTIKNIEKNDAHFVVLKTPNPSEMVK